MMYAYFTILQELAGGGERPFDYSTYKKKIEFSVINL